MLQETIEDMLTRLEECKSTTIDMVKSEVEKGESQMKNILSLKNEIAELAYRMDAMEMFVSRVHQDMDTLETLLVEAEMDFPNKSVNPIKNLFKPILSKVSPEIQGSSGTGLSVGTASVFKKPEVFSTDKFFMKNTASKANNS